MLRIGCGQSLVTLNRYDAVEFMASKTALKRKPAKADPASAASSPAHQPDQQKTGSLREESHYQKVILRPGAFRVPAKKTTPGAFQDETGRWWKEETFTSERLQRIADNSKKILDAGIKIPAPFAHRDKNRKFVMPVKAGSDGASLVDLHDKPLSWDSSLNGGFWREPLQFVQDASLINPEFESGPGLIGKVSTFGDPNDLSSPSGKVSTTVQETSIGLLPKYQPPNFLEPMEDYIAHIAMPVHAIEAGQDNFVQMSDDDEEIQFVAMSAMMDAPNQAGSDVAENDDPEMIEVLGLLQQLKIDLPPDTNRDSLVERLNLVLRQKIADQKEMNPPNPLTQPQAGSSTKPAPVAMSQESATLDSAFSKKMLARETKKTKDLLRQRLARIRSKGMSEDVVTEIEADIDGITMSADDLNDDGEFPTPIAETKIALLERTGHTLTHSLIDDDDAIGMSAPDGSRLEPKPIEGEEELSEEYVNGIAQRAFPVNA